MSPPPAVRLTTGTVSRVRRLQFAGTATVAAIETSGCPTCSSPLELRLYDEGWAYADCVPCELTWMLA